MEQQNIASGGVQCIPQVADVYLATVSVSQSENAVNDDSDLLYEILNNNGTDLSINTEEATQYYRYYHYNNTFSGVLDGYLRLFRNSVTLSKEPMFYFDDHVYYYSDATNTTVNSRSSMCISSGGVANNTTVRGSMHISSGGVANSTTVNGGDMYIDSGVANSTTVNSGGGMDIWYGGVANSTTVNSGGHMFIWSGGTATAIKENGGCVSFANGANVTFVSNTITGLTLSEDHVMTVHSNTVANSTTVNTYGDMSIYSDGVANNTTVNASGWMYIYSGGTANSTTVNSGGFMCISSGGTATAVKENCGCVDVADGANVTFVSNTITGLDLSGYMTIHSNTVANSTTVNSRGDMYIFSGGEANSTTVNNGGRMYISSGGIANSITVNSGGGMNISFGVTATAIKENGGCVSCANGANVTFVSNTITGLNLFGWMTVHSNTVANSTTVNEGSEMVIYRDGVANCTTVDGGNLDIDPGGVANSTTVNSSGDMYISSGGVANSTTVNSSCRMAIVRGVANITTVNSGGLMNINFGEANSTTVNSGGSMHIRNDGVANSTTVNSGGWLNIHSFCVANSTTVNSGGNLYVTSRGEANSTTVNSGGLMRISSGGTAKGGLNIYSGAIVSAYGGAVIDFTVADRTVADGYIVNDLSLISGAPTYTITVDANQNYGTYKLAQNAQDISSTLSINTESGNIGTLTVNGDVLEYNDRKYKLTNSNGNLHLSVQDKNAAEAPVTNLLTNGVSQILAWDAEQGKVGYMATNGNVRPSWRGVWEWSGAEADLWRVAGVGHFKGSEVDYDGVLLYNGVGNRFAAWTDLRKGSYGYVNLCKVDGSFNTQCLANLDGDEYDDILIYDTNGSIGVVLGGTTYKDIFHVNEGDFATWTIEGAGSFDDGMDKLVMVNNYNHQVYLWTNQDTTFATWNWKTQSVGKLESGWEVAAVGDFEGDGIDDIMVLDRNTNNVWVWDDGNSQTKRWRGTLGEGFEIEAAGDYNGDGCADLLLREYNSGWGGLGYWGNGYAGNWVDLGARIETDMKSSFDIIA